MLTVVFIMAVAAFILSLCGAAGKPFVWPTLILLSLALMLLTLPYPVK